MLVKVFALFRPKRKIKWWNGCNATIITWLQLRKRKPSRNFSMGKICCRFPVIVPPRMAATLPASYGPELVAAIMSPGKDLDYMQTPRAPMTPTRRALFRGTIENFQMQLLFYDWKFELVWLLEIATFFILIQNASNTSFRQCQEHTWRDAIVSIKWEPNWKTVRRMELQHFHQHLAPNLSVKRPEVANTLPPANTLHSWRIICCWRIGQLCSLCLMTHENHVKHIEFETYILIIGLWWLRPLLYRFDPCCDVCLLLNIFFEYLYDIIPCICYSI